MFLLLARGIIGRCGLQPVLCHCADPLYYAGVWQQLTAICTHVQYVNILSTYECAFSLSHTNSPVRTNISNRICTFNLLLQFKEPCSPDWEKILIQGSRRYSLPIKPEPFWSFVSLYLRSLVLTSGEWVGHSCVRWRGPTQRPFLH